MGPRREAGTRPLTMHPQSTNTPHALVSRTTAVRTDPIERSLGGKRPPRAAAAAAVTLAAGCAGWPVATWAAWEVGSVQSRLGPPGEGTPSGAPTPPAPGGLVGGEMAPAGGRSLDPPEGRWMAAMRAPSSSVAVAAAAAGTWPVGR